MVLIPLNSGLAWSQQRCDYEARVGVLIPLNLELAWSPMIALTRKVVRAS